MSEPTSYPPETVLTRPELAGWMRCTPANLDAMRLRCIRISERKTVYLMKHVLEDLDRKAVA